jgi:hypothetical protein
MFSAMGHSLTDFGGLQPRPQSCVLARPLGYYSRVKRLVVYVAVAAVLAVSLAAGWVAADWPDWCKRLQWCAQNFPQ